MNNSSNSIITILLLISTLVLGYLLFEEKNKVSNLLAVSQNTNQDTLIVTQTRKDIAEKALDCVMESLNTGLPSKECETRIGLAYSVRGMQDYEILALEQQGGN